MPAEDYPGRIDPECVALCDAINRLEGVRTTECCCGHGDHVFAVYLCVDDLRDLPVLLYYLNPCHVGFKWMCEAHTDCAMSYPTFRVSSLSTGDVAYEEAQVIADKINEFLDEKNTNG